jgi:chaperonin GroEL
LGRCEKVSIDKDNSTIVSGKGNAEDIKARVNQIKAQIENTTSEYDKEKLNERLAKLAGGVAVLYIGAATEVEMKEKKARVDDALHATRAAVQEGIVPGGGVALVRTIAALSKGKGGINDDLLKGDVGIGVAIVRRSLEEPLRQIVANAGLEGAVILQKVIEGKADFGYNARSEQYENLYESGVIDPTKVTRSALENATSIAGLLLTTECVITDEPEEKSAAAMPNPGMGGMGGMM